MVTISLSQSAHEKGRALAKADGRNFSNYLERVLLREIANAENQQPLPA